ncbi:MAG: transcription antitermination factor NusB, partial [Patescibacteria group bacterium]
VNIVVLTKNHITYAPVAAKDSLQMDADRRHQKRQKIVQSLFAWQVHSGNPLSESAQLVVDKQKKIDKLISQCAPKWPLDKINRIDLAILRLAVFELFFDPNIPEKVAIDEAIELAKDFGSENSPAFINGVLGAAYEKLPKKNDN